MKSRWACVVMAACAVAQAQTSRVRIAPLPMKALTGDDQLDRELPKKFEVKLLETKQVECPLSDKVDAFLQTRNACERDVACLKTLAENTSSLYALAATVRMNAAQTAFVVSAILFRVDGKKNEIAFEYKINRDAMTTGAAGEGALKELIARLELEKLERVLPLAVHEEGHFETVGAVDEGAPGRLAGKVVLGVGAASVVIGAIVLGVGAGQAGGVPVVNGNVPLSRKPAEDAAMAAQTGGGAMLGVGAAVAAAGAVIWLMSPSAPVQLGAGPTKSGGAVVLRGTW